MRRNTIIGAILVLLVATIAGCAKQGYPNGGPRDEQPPTVLDTKPQNEGRNFNGRQFSIAFDEYIVVKDADNNVLISPPMREKPEFATKGKRLVVKINDTLQPNTTYLFQFKGAIVDFTEGNVLPSFEYVFSTGDQMDTLMLAGRVLGARDGKPWKETVTVMAYKAERAVSDTVATTEQPDYITRCDKDGVFAFHYIPAGSYRLVAVEDKNRDLRVGRGESAAWEPTLVQASDSIDSVNVTLLRISEPDRSVQRVVKAEFSAKGRASIITLLPMQEPALTGDSLEWRLNKGRDTMMVWFRNVKCDSTQLVLSDSGLQDTLKLRFREAKRRRRSGPSHLQKNEDAMVRPLCSGSNAFYDDLRLGFSVPIATMADSAKVEVLRMKDSNISRSPIVMDSTGMEARIMATLRSGEEYKMHLRDSLFTDIFGHYSDSLDFSLTPCDYGILSLQLTNNTGSPLVVEVLDKNDTVVARRSVIASGEVRIDHLKADEYRLRAVLDSDANGVWTTGDYIKGRQPEYIVYYSKSLKLREKWELEEYWILSKSDFGRTE
jgi:hypothetical protein